MGGRFSTRLKALPEVHIDLEAAEPRSDEERSISTRFQEEVIIPSGPLFARFGAYRDMQEFAAAAISNPSDATKAAAWEAVCPNIELQMEVVDFAHLLTRHFRDIVHLALEHLLLDSSAAIFETVPALTRSLADAFDLILTLDELKLAAPKLINDLAYFRRNANTYNTNGQFDRMFERSNETTIFWAAPTPALSLAIQWLAKDYPPADDGHQKLLTLLGGVSDVGTSILTYHPSDHEKTNKLCLRCIVAGTLMYDHIAATGAFGVPARFHVKKGMRILVGFQPKPAVLINAIKYGAKHLGEASDPEIKALFA